MQDLHGADNLPWNISEIQHYQEEKLPLGIIIPFNIIAGVVVVVNSFHLYMVCHQPRLKKLSYYNYKLFLITLAVLDLCLGAARVILSNDFFQNLLETHRAFCTTTAVYVHFTYTSMVSLIVMVSVDRAYCLNQSVAYQSRHFVKRYPTIVLVILIFFATVYTVLGIIFNKTGISTKDVGTCTFGSYEIPILAAPTVVLIFVYLLILTGVYIHIIVLTRMHIASHSSSRDNRRITEVTKTIGAIIGASFMCWLPPIASAFLWAVGIPSVGLEIYALIVVELNSLANPLLYGLANSTYRAMVYHKVRTWCRSSGVTKNGQPEKESKTLSSFSTTSITLT